VIDLIKVGKVANPANLSDSLNSPVIILAKRRKMTREVSLGLGKISGHQMFWLSTSVQFVFSLLSAVSTLKMKSSCINDLCILHRLT
jgi:hypothetical protein